MSAKALISKGFFDVETGVDRGCDVGYSVYIMMKKDTNSMINYTHIQWGPFLVTTAFPLTARRFFIVIADTSVTNETPVTYETPPLLIDICSASDAIADPSVAIKSAASRGTSVTDGYGTKQALPVQRRPHPPVLARSL